MGRPPFDNLPPFETSPSNGVSLALISIGPALPLRPRFDARMPDNQTISQLEAEGYPWIGCECCKGTVWVPFRMLRERLPMLSAMTLDQLGARMKCDRRGAILSCKPERHARVRSKEIDALVSPLRRSHSSAPWSPDRYPLGLRSRAA